MARDLGNIWVSFIVMIAFWIATVISVWKLFADGARIIIIIPSICFPIAAVLWTISVFNWRNRNKDK